ncbi:MAG: hypothetical protein AB7H90_22270 [Alphaproteobacteria bacterium]
MARERSFFHRTGLAATILAVGLVSFAAGSVAQYRFSRMNQAYEALNAALWHLRAAPNGIFGGHKNQAELLIADAMRQIEAAKAWAISQGY